MKKVLLIFLFFSSMSHTSDRTVVDIINEFEPNHESNMSDSIFFSNLGTTNEITISYDTVDFISGNGTMDVTFSIGSADPNTGNWAGLNFTNNDGSRMDFSAAETLSVMLKVETPPNFPQYMSMRFMVIDKPVYYGFNEHWAGEDVLLIDQESDWMEVKIPLKPHRSTSLFPITGSNINDGFNISPWWWNLQYNNWQLDLDRVGTYAIYVGTNGYGANVSTLPADSVKISLDYMTLKDSSGYEHIYNFSDQLDSICLAPQEVRQELIETMIADLPEIPYIEIREGIIGDYMGVDSDEENYAMAHFLYFAPSNHDVVAVNGSWNDWNGTLWNMSNIPNTNFWFRPMVMPHTGRFLYTYWADGTYYDDPMNDISCMAWNYGITDQVSGPDYIIPPEWAYNDTIPHGSYFDTTFFSSTMDNSRNVTVYLPPNYEYTNNFYPVVVYQDGNRILPRAPENIFDNLIHDEKINPIIAVFIPPVNRNAEYRSYFQEDYTDFVIDDILGWAMNKYRILDGPENHANIGFSDGGCITIYQGLSRYDFFGKIGAFAPTINIAYNQMVQSLGNSVPELEIYMEGYWFDQTIWQGLAFRETLISNGFNVTWNDFPDGHELCGAMGNQDLVLEQFFAYEELEVEDPKNPLPLQYTLHSPYPNPFNPITKLQYDLPENALVNITIYDMMGRVVSNLVSSQQNAGYKSIQWNATNNLGEPVSAGMYIYMIQAGEFRQTKKMVLLK